MAASLPQALETYNQLKAEWKNQNLDKCGTLLRQMKILLTEFSFLPSGNAAPNTQELMLARDVLELGAQWSLKKNDLKSFQRYIAQLKTYYLDHSTQLPPSPYVHELLGLNLLCLLSQNRIAEFHTELEQLDPKLLHDDLYIRHPVQLEQHLMEGSYNKVYLARSNVPAESYVFFIDQLMDTIREEVAGCMEKAYDSLPSSSVQSMLFCEDKDTAADIIAAHEWTVEGDTVHFPNNNNDKVEIKSEEMINRTLHYAVELEKIV